MVLSKKKCFHWDNPSEKDAQMPCERLKYALSNPHIPSDYLEYLEWISTITMHYKFKLIKDEDIIAVLRKVGLRELKSIYEAVEKKSDDLFLKELENLRKQLEIDEIINIMYEKFTLFQAACIFGFIESAKWFISESLKTSDGSISRVERMPGSQMKPIQLACRHAQLHIVKLLLLHLEEFKFTEMPVTKSGNSLIHLTVKSLKDSDPKEALKCLKEILKVEVIKKGIDQEDRYGGTPLLYASMIENEEFVLELLQNGAQMYILDKWQHSPIDYIEHSTLAKFLDSRISDNDGEDDEIDDKRENYKIIFNFKDLFSNEKDESEEKHKSQTKVLSMIRNQKRLKPLLTHPVITVMLLLKWERVQFAYIPYLAFYLLYCIVLLCDVFTEDYKLSSCNDYSPKLHMLAAILRPVPQNSPKPSSDRSYDCLRYGSPFRYILMVMTTYLIVLEVTKMFHILEYLKNQRNFLRLLTLLSTVSVFICSFAKDIVYCTPYVAVSVLLNGLELFLLIGRLPFRTDYITRFQKVSSEIGKFIAFHLILLLAFSLSFYILFRNVDGENPFSTIGDSIFKTVIMLTGEYNAEGIPFNSSIAIVSHIIFIGFLFVGVIVLYNLLSIAASVGSKKLEKDPLLYKNISRLDLIIHTEQNYLYSKNSFQNMLQYIFLFKWALKKVKAGSELLDRETITFVGKDKFELLRESKKEKQDLVTKVTKSDKQGQDRVTTTSLGKRSFNLDNESEKEPKKCFISLDFFSGKLNLNDETVKRVQKIVAKKSRNVTNEEIEQKLAEFNNRMTSLENAIKNLTQAREYPLKNHLEGSSAENDSNSTQL